MFDCAFLVWPADSRIPAKSAGNSCQLSLSPSKLAIVRTEGYLTASHAGLTAIIERIADSPEGLSYNRNHGFLALLRLYIFFKLRVPLRLK